MVRHCVFTIICLGSCVLVSCSADIYYLYYVFVIFVYPLLTVFKTTLSMCLFFLIFALFIGFFFLLTFLFFNNFKTPTLGPLLILVCITSNF